MRSHFRTVHILFLWLLVSFSAKPDNAVLPQDHIPKTFAAIGGIKAVQPAEKTVIIQHQAISNYMAAMTMPFTVKDAKDLDGLKPGDEVAFELNVTETKSWVSHIVKIGTVNLPAEPAKAAPAPTATQHPLFSYTFTNELGQPVKLSDFRGQALAITFFYTRCPLPEFCPRLSKNFQAVQRQLESTPNAPTNWHLVSVTFDPEFDTPERLKNYGDSYQYDPAHWSFFTGTPENLAAFARVASVELQPEAGTINHNFRTLILDTTGNLQMIFPTSGDFSDQITAQMLKAMTPNPK